MTPNLKKLDATNWLHVAGVFDGDNDPLRLYVDGNLVGYKRYLQMRKSVMDEVARWWEEVGKKRV